MPNFFITWTIDLSADDATDAARKALRIHRDPESIATVFTVKGYDGVTVDVDLEGHNGKPGNAAKCPECGSLNIAASAAARYNAVTQEWELSCVHDTTICQECDHEFYTSRATGEG